MRVALRVPAVLRILHFISFFVGSKLLIFTLSPHSRLGRELELLTRAMALPSAWSAMRVVIPLISVLGLLSVRLVGASQDSGSVIPAESTYCRAALMPRCTRPALCPPLAPAATQTAPGHLADWLRHTLELGALGFGAQLCINFFYHFERVSCLTSSALK